MVWWSEVDSERSGTALARKLKGLRGKKKRNGVKEKRKWERNRWSE